MLLNLSYNSTLEVSRFKLANIYTKLCIVQIIEEHTLFWRGHRRYEKAIKKKICYTIVRA